MSPSVGILAGTDADLEILKDCTARLGNYGIPLAAGRLGGFDALLGAVRLPEGAPVATVAINGAANAAVLAAQIVALSDPDLVDRLGG